MSDIARRFVLPRRRLCAAAALAIPLASRASGEPDLRLPDDGAIIPVQDALRKGNAGGTIIFKAGRYDLSGQSLPPRVQLFAPDGARLLGTAAMPGPATALRGFTIEAGSLDLSNSRGVVVADCVFQKGETSIKLDNAERAIIINNDFHEVSGSALTGWHLDRSVISGNHFTDCRQCINLDFVNDPSRGRDIVIERNVFTGTTRMPVEVGPKGASTENIVVCDNWATDFRNLGPDPGDSMSTYVAYSIVPTYGRNSLIAGNYALAGPHGRGRIGIELDGSGEIRDNYVEDFDFGAIVYGAGFTVRDNAFVRTTEGHVLNYSRRSGKIGKNGDGPRAPRFAAPPQRRSWPLPPTDYDRLNQRLRTGQPT